MFLGPALKLCPDLATIPYDFPGYEEVSRILYDTVASYTLDIQVRLNIEVQLLNEIFNQKIIDKSMISKEHWI